MRVKKDHQLDNFFFDVPSNPGGSGYSPMRFLSILGKIQVIKPLAISKFVYLLTALPTSREPFLKELETLLFSFIWSGKRDKVAS